MINQNIPRTILTTLPTALEKMTRLSSKFGRSDLYIKRDDCTTLAGGGNKTRKLEYTMGDALAKGANVIITAGAYQSNHVRQTAAAAAKLGLECHAVMSCPNPDFEQDFLKYGNYLLDDLFGLNMHLIENDDDIMFAKLSELENKFKSEGRVPYIVPIGASDGVGSLGYVQCAEEMLEQFKEKDIAPTHIVLATGSAGTHAGLLLGLRLLGSDIKVLGISVSELSQAKINKVRDVINQISKVLNCDGKIVQDDDIRVLDQYYGKAYAYPTDGGNNALRILAQAEGILLDPVYTAKAFHGFTDQIENGELKNGNDIVFLHTGGAMAIHAYSKSLI